MNREELLRKAELAMNASELRKERLEHIVEVSKSTVTDDKTIRGMLYLISVMDDWVAEYERELNRKKVTNG
jgi:hypothetical protein